MDVSNERKEEPAEGKLAARVISQAYWKAIDALASEGETSSYSQQHYLNTLSPARMIADEFPDWFPHEDMLERPSVALRAASRAAAEDGMEVAALCLTETALIARRFPEWFGLHGDAVFEDTELRLSPKLMELFSAIADGVANGGSVVMQEISSSEVTLLDEFAREIHQMFWDIGMPEAADMVRDRYVAKTGRDGIDG